MNPHSILLEIIKHKGHCVYLAPQVCDNCPLNSHSVPCIDYILIKSKAIAKGLPYQTSDDLDNLTFIVANEVLLEMSIEEELSHE